MRMERIEYNYISILMAMLKETDVQVSVVVEGYLISQGCRAE